MEATGFYRILGLKHDCSIDEIKKAYRIIAREYHPDHNSDPEAVHKFIAATEAYEFLITNHAKLASGNDESPGIMDDWQRYRARQARQRAGAFANVSYSTFSNTDFYKTTRFFSKTIILISVVISVLVMSVAIFGYFYRLRHPIPGIKDPPVIILIVFILLGLILSAVSFIHLKAFLEEGRKRRSGKHK